MKILFAITGYLPELFGGAEVYTQNLATALLSRGHNVRVATLDLKHKRGYATDENYEGVPVHRLAFVSDFRPAPFYALQFYPEMYDEATEYLKTVRPDVVHVTNAWFVSAFTMAALHQGIPVIGTHVDYLWTCRDSHLLRPERSLCGEAPPADCRACFADLSEAQWTLVRQYRWQLFRLLAEAYSYHHCPCPFLGEHIHTLGAPKDNIGVWPYGIPQATISARHEKTPSDVLRLAFIGRWNRIKGIHVLLEALELLGERYPVQLDIYGEQEVWNTDTYGQEQAYRAALLSTVLVKGRFTPARVGQVHRDIDVLVTPSIWPENSPVSMLEALALGTPCLCADGEGMTNLIESGRNGLVFRSRDARNLADKIALLATSPELVRRIKDGAKPIRTIEDDATAFESVYARCRPVSDLRWHAASRTLVDTLRYAHEVYQADALALPRKARQKFAELERRGLRRVALFGAGRHTLKLLGFGEITGVEIVAILDENPQACGGTILKYPVRHLAEASELGLDAVVVSSDAFEAQMIEKARFLRDRGIVVTGFYHEDDR